MRPELITIPSDDTAFRRFLQRSITRDPPASTRDFEHRLRRIYPRALVRERGLAGEAPAWYVYREGAWRAPSDGSWWMDPAVPRVVISADGWIEEANRTAQGLLGIEPPDREPRHFTDFVVAGAAADAVDLFDVVREAGSLDASVMLLPTTGDAVAVDMRATSENDRIVASLRLAAAVDVSMTAPRHPKPESVAYVPPIDVAFRAYGERALARMPEPTPDGFALRLRRLYPHAHVEATVDGWVARRDHHDAERPSDPWWERTGLPQVRYDTQALILDANAAATEYFGRPLIGHHWQEFVTAGSTEEVGVMLEILAEAGAAESRFRMPRGDGTLLEFDSYTVVDGEDFTTVFRPVHKADQAPAR